MQTSIISIVNLSSDMSLSLSTAVNEEGLTHAQLTFCSTRAHAVSEISFVTSLDLFSVLDCFCGTAFKTGLCDVFLVDVGVWILDAVADK